MMNLGFLASHQGSNMQAVIDACNEGRLNAQVAVVISNNSKSGALARARQESIPYYHLSSKTHPDVDALDQAICHAMTAHQVDLIVLAGYMRKLGRKTLDAYNRKIINIHPALLPKFGGKGMYGNHVHQAVLDAGETETGVTIHLVDGGYDTGAILAQCRVAIAENDSVETLRGRVLAREHTFLVETLSKIVKGEIRLD